MTFAQKFMKKSRTHSALFLAAVVILLVLYFMNIISANASSLAGLVLVLIFLFVVFMDIVNITRTKNKPDSSLKHSHKSQIHKR